MRGTIMRRFARTGTAVALAGAVMAVGFLGACSLTGQGEGQTDTPDIEVTDTEADVTEDETDDNGEGTAMGTQQLEADGILAYVAQVGYKDGFGYDTVTISDKEGWDEFADAMADVYYDGDGTEMTSPNPALRDYDEGFFADGSKLLVTYMDLGSSGYNPTITGMHVDGDTATVTCDLGQVSGMFFTTDMSGFVTILEVPADSGVTAMKVLAD